VSESRFELDQGPLDKSKEIVKGPLGCPECQGRFKVIETRSASDCVRRIRQCRNCSERYLTEEYIIDKRNYIQ